jgi:hypothetical protein
MAVASILGPDFACSCPVVYSCCYKTRPPHTFLARLHAPLSSPPSAFARAAAPPLSAVALRSRARPRARGLHCSSARGTTALPDA